MGRNEREMVLLIRRVERIARGGTVAVISLVLAEMQRRTPRDTNFAAASLQINVGSAFPGFPKNRDGRQHTVPIPIDIVHAAMTSWEIGDTVVLNALASYYNILAGGRRPDKNGRMIGSEQAPEPYMAPAIKTALVAAQSVRIAA